MTRTCLFILSLVASTATAAAGVGFTPPFSTGIQNYEVNVGNVAIVEIERREIEADRLRLDFGGKQIQLFPHPMKPNTTVCGILPIHFNTSPGEHAAEVTWTRDGGVTLQRVPLLVIKGEYPSTIVKVNKNKAEPDEASREQAKRDWQEISAIYDGVHPERLWRGAFQKPVNSKVTSPYGVMRLFNGTLQSYHTGVDLRAWMGTPIRAANSGIVRLAKNLFYAGNQVIIDHGLGLFTSYSHFSKFKVKVGDQVAKGQVIGLSGATGRVSGPHLHWGAKASTVTVDGLQLIEALKPLVTATTAAN